MVNGKGCSHKYKFPWIFSDSLVKKTCSPICLCTNETTASSSPPTTFHFTLENSIFNVRQILSIKYIFLLPNETDFSFLWINTNLFLHTERILCSINTYWREWEDCKKICCFVFGCRERKRLRCGRGCCCGLLCSQRQSPSCAEEAWLTTADHWSSMANGGFFSRVQSTILEALLRYCSIWWKSNHWVFIFDSHHFCSPHLQN